MHVQQKIRKLLRILFIHVLLRKRDWQVEAELGDHGTLQKKAHAQEHQGHKEEVSH